ncbi:MAG: DUF2283 domain-containing protein [Bacteroidetes bacterium]|nr:DUF2283 domain-containing protein [Bacteroidota bacterium]MBU2505606.1 DUF2283 domain-containing protein [Bacteroidota bacterium]
MKVSYDQEADAAYIELSNKKPEGVIEVKEGVNLDVTADGIIVGIELLDAGKKISLKSFLSYEFSPGFVNKAI